MFSCSRSNGTTSVTSFILSFLSFCVVCSCIYNQSTFYVAADEAEHMHPLNPAIKYNLLDLIHFHKNHTAVPLFWHIPRAAPGGTLIDLMGNCLQQVLAYPVEPKTAGNSSNHTQHNDDDDIFRIRTTHNGMRFVNIDTGSVEGMLAANEMGFAGSGLADVVISTKLYEAIELLFDDKNPGRLFTMMRNPIDREVSVFFHIQKFRPNITLLEYADIVPNTKEGRPKEGNEIKMRDNYMTRILLGDYEHQINTVLLNRAKWILYTRTLVGIFEKMENSVRRFGRLLGWNEFDSWHHCIHTIEYDPDLGETASSIVKKGSREYKALTKNLEFDIELYDYAKRMFEIQNRYDIQDDQ